MIARLERRTAALLDWAATSSWRQAAIVSAVALALLIPGLTALPVTDRDEARFAQASKQMIETGDLVDIRFQDQPRWKKPAGIYWLQAGSASLLGGADAPIWAYRLPSLLAAWLAALATLWAGRVVIGPRPALLAGLMMASTLLLVAEGHIAKTDAALAATAATVLGALGHLAFGEGGWRTALLFWLSLAAAVLLKGPIVPVIAVFALVLLAWRRETRPRLARLRAHWGAPLAILLVAPWLVAIWIVSDGGFFAESIGQDMAAKVASGQENHWGPPGLYLALVWLTFWPWAAYLPQAAGWVWTARRLARIGFLLAWLVPFWLVLEAVPTKLPHYVLPLYPALALLVAAALGDRPASARWTRRAGAILLVLPGVAIAIAVIALPLVPRFATADLIPIALSPGAVLLALAAVAALLVAVRAAWAGARLAQFTASLVAALCLYPAILAFALPAASTAFPSPALARAIKKWQPCASGPAFSVGYHEPSLVFLTDTSLRMADPQGAKAALAEDSGALVLIEDRWARILDPLPPAVERARITYFNPNRGKIATARLLTPDDSRWQACAGAD